MGLRDVSERAPDVVGVAGSVGAEWKCRRLVMDNYKLNMVGGRAEGLFVGNLVYSTGCSFPLTFALTHELHTSLSSSFQHAGT